MTAQTQHVSIRPRTIQDMDGLAAVAARVHTTDRYPIHLPGREFHRFLDNPTPLLSFVADQAGAVVGHVALNETTSRPVMELIDSDKPPAPPIYIARLLVDTGSRRTGLGRRLLGHARAAAVDAGRQPYLDVVNIPTARPAIELYEAQGWTRIGRVPFRLGGNELEEIVFRGPRR